MLPRSLVALGLGLGVWLAIGGCSRHGDDGEGGEQRPPGALSGDGPSAPARGDRLPALRGDAIGAQPGYVEGAVIHAAVAIGPLHAMLRTLPLDAEMRRDLDDLAKLIPDPTAADVLARHGLDPDAVLSMSLRPINTGEEQLRALVHQPSAALTEMRSFRGAGGRLHDNGAYPVPKVIEAPEPPEDPLEAAPEQPPPPPQKPSATAIALDNKIKTLGVHLRAHLPVADLAKLRPLLARMQGEFGKSRWATTCASLGPTLACGGESDSVVVIREHAGGVSLDLLLTFIGDYEQPDNPQRRAAIQQAIARPAATPLAVASLRGDFGVAFDGPGVVGIVRSAALSRALAHGNERGVIDRFDAGEAAITELRASPSTRVFTGLTIEGALGADLINAQARWRVSPSARQHLAQMFELSEIDADVPTIPALCDGALLCARSRGVPSFDRFADLATGVYTDPVRLGRLIDRHEDAAAAALLLETWPNAIASIGYAPRSFDQGPEAFVAQNAFGVLSRLLGFGLSVRSIDEFERSFRGDWIAYARLSASDLNAITGFMKLADIPLTETTIPGVDARVSYARIPERDIDGNFYGLAESNEKWGWAVIADADDRVQWFAGLAHDDGAAPLVYAEISDLWRLIDSNRDAREELDFARAWLAQRWVRGQIERGDDGAPIVRMAMGKR